MALDVEEIKDMKLKGKPIGEIAKYYGVGKGSVSTFLKRRGIIFWKLPKKCAYCGKIFKPFKPNHKFCSDKCRKYNNSDNKNRAYKRYYKRVVKLKGNYLDRTHPTINYKEAYYYLNKKKNESVCSFCGGENFEIKDGEVYCLKCGLCL